MSKRPRHANCSPPISSETLVVAEKALSACARMHLNAVAMVEESRQATAQAIAMRNKAQEVQP